MGTLKKWKDSAMFLAEQHEQVLTCLLVGVAIVLLAIAFFGKAHHKAGALIYIVL